MKRIIFISIAIFAMASCKKECYVCTSCSNCSSGVFPPEDKREYYTFERCVSSSDKETIHVNSIGGYITKDDYGNDVPCELKN